MQNFLAYQQKGKHMGGHVTRSGHFAFSDDEGEEQKLEGADAINRVIDE